MERGHHYNEIAPSNVGLNNLAADIFKFIFLNGNGCSFIQILALSLNFFPMV